MHPKPMFWFPVKRYGWGWGLPVCWQGWLVFVSYMILIVGGVVYFLLQRNPLALFGYIWGLTAILVVIVAVKGERPVAWRWGGK
jgi:drug/metabolite transporter (DMT)-like permease